MNKKFYGYRNILVLALILAFLPQPALADIAPPEQPPGGNPVPGAGVTQVRMLAETVLFEVISVTPANSLGRAKVTAKFTMVNLGMEDETMAVRFPMTSNYGSDYGNKELEAFQANVGGSQAQVTEITSDYNGYYAGLWAEFRVTFPAGRNVNIEVTYFVEGEGEYPFIALKYILQTGAGWSGTIGSADLVVRLPYEANAENVIFDTEIGWSTTTSGGTLDGKEIRWHLEDFDPDMSSDFSISLIMPSVWRAVLREKDNLAQNPSDGEAWGRLGKLYKECFYLRKGFREDEGGKELYQLSLEAYQKAVTLLPEDALWLAGFADLLWGHWYYDQSFKQQPDYTEMVRALELLKKSMEIDPENEKAITILDDMRYSVPEAVRLENGQYILLLLTATPTVAPTRTDTPLPTATVKPTETPAPTLKATYTLQSVKTTFTQPTPLETTAPTQPASAPKSRLPGCGALGLAPLAFFFWLKKRQV